MRLNLSEGQLQKSIGMTEPEAFPLREGVRMSEKGGRFLPGQTFQAEVVSRNGNQIQLLLGKDVMLEARLNQSMNLDIGKLFTFEVRGNGKNLTLSPLFANTANQANALKALEMAGIPVSAATVGMADKMMEAGLSIDRSSMQQMFQKMNAFPQEEISNMILLSKMNLPVNQENLTQMTSYRNLTHQIVRGAEEIVEQLSLVWDNSAEVSNPEGTAKLMLSLLDLVDVSAENSMEHVSPELAMKFENPETAVLTASEDPGTAAFANPLVEDPTKDQAATESGKLPADSKQTVSQERDQTNGEANRILQKLRINLADALLEKNVGRLKEMTGDKTLQKFLSGQLMKQWTITPKEVAENGKVAAFYEKISRQLKTLAQSLEQNGQTNTGAFRAVTIMQENLDFLHQINQIYTYVQLPVRLQQGNAHGDLYVYSNKKNLAASDGQISALLHLDMEHLGPVDVYVAMQAEKVNNRFYVQDDEMLAFLEKHMDLLTQRLNKRGYQCSFEMQMRDPGENAISGINGLMREQSTVSVAQYAFDVRA